MKEKKFLAKRKWLNPINSSDTGMIATEVLADDFCVGGVVDIWDCSRKITLDFNVYSKGDLSQRKKKLRIMIEMLEDVYDTMDKAYDYHLKAKAERKNK